MDLCTMHTSTCCTVLRLSLSAPSSHLQSSLGTPSCSSTGRTLTPRRISPCCNAVFRSNRQSHLMQFQNALGKGSTHCTLKEWRMRACRKQLWQGLYLVTFIQIHTNVIQYVCSFERRKATRMIVQWCCLFANACYFLASADEGKRHLSQWEEGFRSSVHAYLTIISPMSAQAGIWTPGTCVLAAVHCFCSSSQSQTPLVSPAYHSRSQLHPAGEPDCFLQQRSDAILTPSVAAVEYSHHSHNAMHKQVLPQQ